MDLPPLSFIPHFGLPSSPELVQMGCWAPLGTCPVEGTCFLEGSLLFSLQFLRPSKPVTPPPPPPAGCRHLRAQCVRARALRAPGAGVEGVAASAAQT